jgi:hypothetical protein
VCGKARGKTPWWHGGPYLLHAKLAIKEDKVDLEAHEKGVDGFARRQPQTFPGREGMLA